MEKKILTGMLLSCLAVAALIFCGRKMFPADDSSSAPDTPPVLETSATTTTDFWDYLHAQTAETTATDENGNPVTTPAETDENGNPVTTSAATDENGNPVSGTEDTTSVTTTTTTTTITAPSLVYTG